MEDVVTEDTACHVGKSVELSFMDVGFRFHGWHGVSTHVSCERAPFFWCKLESCRIWRCCSMQDQVRLSPDRDALAVEQSTSCSETLLG